MNVIYYAAIPYFITFMVIELWYARKKKKENSNYTLKDTAASLSMGIGNLVISGLVVSFKLGVLFFAYEMAPFKLGNQWWAWVLAIIGVDICMYWGHRAGHRIRFFWASHVVHHSSTHYNYSTALRQTWTGNPISIFFYMPLAFLGFHPSLILTGFAFNLLYQFWVHTEYVGKLPRVVEFIFSTPSHHRVHHASDEMYLDKNYGGIFILWDRLFKTFQEEQEQPTYGLTENIHSYNPFYIAFHEWGSMIKNLLYFRGVKNKLLAITGPPGLVKSIELEQGLPENLPLKTEVQVG